MKKFFALAIVMVSMFSAFNANAQENNSNNNNDAQAVTVQADGKQWSEKQNKISVSYGQASLPSFLDEFGSDLFHDHEHYTCYGNFNVAYYHNINKRFSVGLDASFEQGKITNENRGYKKSMKYFSLMPSARVYWFHAPKVSMYSKLAFGFCHFDQKMLEDNMEYPYAENVDRNEYWYAGHVSPVGVEFGNQTLRAFGEVGFGFEGGLQAGIRYAF